ncbi:hypothetical protein SAMN05880592_106104 [Bosea sp. TND4EK4]|nr:hypothetical protein SAMN05880592_106104 [Bosea sp. TND4EK4]
MGLKFGSRLGGVGSAGAPGAQARQADLPMERAAPAVASGSGRICMAQRPIG